LWASERFLKIKFEVWECWILIIPLHPVVLLPLARARAHFATDSCHRESCLSVVVARRHPAAFGFGQRVASFVSPEAGSLGLLVVDVSRLVQNRFFISVWIQFRMS